MLLKLPSKVLMCLIGFGNHQHSGGVLVEPMHNAWSAHSADSREVRTVVQKPMDEGADGMSWSRMYDQPGRFVEDDQVRIFMEDFQRAGFGNEFQWLRRREDPSQLISFVQTTGGTKEDGAVEANMPVGNQSLGGDARGDFRMCGQ